MKTAIPAIFYFLTGILFILLQKHLGIIPLFVLKALIIPFLMILFISNLNLRMNRLHLLIAAGLFFSWAGDVLLEVPVNYKDMFIPGLVCFLLAHLMYLITFFKTPGENYIIRRRPYLLLPIVFAGAALIFYLYNGLGELKIAVITYSIVILAMLSGAVNRYEKVNKRSYLLVLTGAILFVISDSALAINIFSHHFKGASAFIMSTYILAQFLIISGYIKQFRRDFA
jgi:uncharacterized membrane protein YhhN